MKDFVRIGNTKDIISETEKAICLPIGKTFSGDTIYTWYPKSSIVKKPASYGWSLFAPVWTNRNRKCTIGSHLSIPGGMIPYDDLNGIPYQF